MRVWGEDAAVLERAGADLGELSGLERAIAAEVPGAGGGDR